MAAWRAEEGAGLTVGLCVPRDLGHQLGRIEADAKRLRARVVPGGGVEAEGLLPPLELVAADGDKGPALVERRQPPHVLGRRQPAVHAAQQPVTAGVGLGVQQCGERVGVGRQVQRPAATFHVVALGHVHEREVVQLVQRVVERVLLLIDNPGYTVLTAARREAHPSSGLVHMWVPDTEGVWMCYEVPKVLLMPACAAVLYSVRVMRDLFGFKHNFESNGCVNMPNRASDLPIHDSGTAFSIPVAFSTTIVEASRCERSGSSLDSMYTGV